MNHAANLSTPDEQGEVSLARGMIIVIRQRRMVMLTGIAITVLFVLASLLRSTTWTATASFTPQGNAAASEQRLSMLAGQFGLSVGGGEPSQSPQFYVDLIESRAVLQRLAEETFEVVDTLGFWRDGRIQGSIADILRFEGETERRRTFQTVKWLREEAVNAEVKPETGIVRVSVTTPWPDLSVDLASRIIEVVHEFNVNSRQSQAAAERRFAEERMETTQQELRAAEEQLELFLVQNRSFGSSPELAFQHDRLQRQVAGVQQVYTSLVDAYEQARIAEVRNTPVVTVIEHPSEPAIPDSRRLSLFAALGLILGSATGVFVALFLHWLKHGEGGSNAVAELRNAVNEMTVGWNRLDRLFRNTK